MVGNVLVVVAVVVLVMVAVVANLVGRLKYKTNIVLKHIKNNITCVMHTVHGTLYTVHCALYNFTVIYIRMQHCTVH